MRSHLAPALLVLLAACSGSGDDPSSQDVGVDSSIDDSPIGDAPRDAIAEVPKVDAPPDSPPPPPCGTNAWSTYNHDAQRTGASDACITGPLTVAWKYKPTPSTGKKTNFVVHAVADAEGVYLQWAMNDASYLGTSALDRISLDGKHQWTYDTGTDSNLGHWPSLAFTYVVMNDDGLYYVDKATGAGAHSAAVDYWGQTLFDGTRLLVVNDLHVDGPGVFVGAYDDTAKQLWAKNQYGTCRIDVGDLDGGIALDGGVLFYAASYSAGSGVTLPFASGVYAFDAAKGDQKWTKAASPTGEVSAGGGKIFLVEDGKNLVARAQSDGSIAWSTPLAGGSTQAPVLAGSLVVTAQGANVVAFDAASGKSAWTSPTSATVPQLPFSFSGGCVTGVSSWSPVFFGGSVRASTTLAAALASETLIVAAGTTLHVLSLVDGKEQWSGAVTGSKGALRDPVIVGKRVYVMDDEGIIALDAK